MLTIYKQIKNVLNKHKKQLLYRAADMLCYIMHGVATYKDFFPYLENLR